MTCAWTKAVVLLAVLLTATTLDAKSGVLPPPSGPSPVGRTILYWTDAARDEAFSSKPGDRRAMAVWLWYPAAPQADAKTAPYIDQIDKWKGALSRSDISMAGAVQTHAVADAPPAPAPDGLPVILFSSGSSAMPALYTSLCEELASHGYVVAALGHPYDDRAVMFADGRIVREAKQPSGDAILPFLRERVSVRAQDLRFALDQLARLQSGEIPSAFRGRLNLQRVAAFGHSTGGMTAAEFCLRDTRALACANLDGVVEARPAYLDESGRGPAQPFMFIDKPLTAMRREKPEDAFRRQAYLREQGNAVLAGVRSGRSYRVTIKDATHASFSDEEILADDSDPRPQAVLQIVRGCLLAFFDQTLRGQDAPLLAPTPADNEIRIEVFVPVSGDATRETR